LEVSASSLTLPGHELTRDFRYDNQRHSTLILVDTIYNYTSAHRQRLHMLLSGLLDLLPPSSLFLVDTTYSTQLVTESRLKTQTIALSSYRGIEDAINQTSDLFEPAYALGDLRIGALRIARVSRSCLSILQPYLSVLKVTRSRKSIFRRAELEPAPINLIILLRHVPDELIESIRDVAEILDAMDAPLQQVRVQIVLLDRELDVGPKNMRELAGELERLWSTGARRILGLQALGMSENSEKILKALRETSQQIFQDGGPTSSSQRLSEHRVAELIEKYQFMIFRPTATDSKVYQEGGPCEICGEIFLTLGQLGYFPHLIIRFFDFYTS
jgi:hypothetical protein